jgi:hypothetical protein
VLASGALELVVRPGVWVDNGWSSLYGLLSYLQGDRTRVFVGDGFDRDKMMLLSKAQEPARNYIHELQLPIVIDVEVRHLTDVAKPGV